MVKKPKLGSGANQANTQNIFYIVVIGILLILVAYLFGKSQTSVVTGNGASPTVLLTPTPTETPSPTPVKKTFNIQACTSNAQNIGQNCLNDCTNQSDIKSRSCPTNDLGQHQSCLNNLLILNSMCLSDCNSTAKVAVNNCRLGISP